MSEFRLKSTGEIVSREQLRQKHWNVSLPAVWNSSTLEFLGVDVIFETPQPSNTYPLKSVIRDGVVKDSKGNWVQNWVVRDIFQDITNQDGTITTKAQQEQEFLSKRTSDQWKVIRTQRDQLLKESDWVTIRSVDTGQPVSQEWSAYRQALRDITTQTDPFAVQWPEKPV